MFTQWRQKLKCFFFLFAKQENKRMTSSTGCYGYFQGHCNDVADKCTVEVTLQPIDVICNRCYGNHLVAMVTGGNQMHCGRYDKNCLTFQIPILLSGELARWQAEVTGLVLGSFFLGGRYYRYLLRYLYFKQTLYAVTGPSAFYNREWPSLLLSILLYYTIPTILCIHSIVGIV